MESSSLSFGSRRRSTLSRTAVYSYALLVVIAVVALLVRLWGPDVVGVESSKIAWLYLAQLVVLMFGCSVVLTSAIGVQWLSRRQSLARGFPISPVGPRTFAAESL